MRILFLTGLLFLIGCGENSNESKSEVGESDSPPFVHVDYKQKGIYPFNVTDKIEVYSYEDTTFSRKPSLIVDGNFSVINQKEFIELNGQQIDTLEKILFGYTGGTDDLADCYDPRHTIVFYKEGIAITFLEICFACGGVRIFDWKNSDFKVDFSDKKRRILSDFLKKIGITYFGPYG